MDAIREKHRGLLDSIAKVYDLLMTMRYISSSDVSYPPHLSPRVDVARLQSLGFNDEVINLTQALPTLRPGVTWGWERKGAIDGMGYARAADDYYDDDDLLPPWVISLSSGGSWGIHLLYNTQDASMTEPRWINSRKSWSEYPSRPAEVVISEIIRKLQTLEWVPFFDPLGSADDEPPAREIVDSPTVIYNGLYYQRAKNPLPMDDIQAALDRMGQDFGHSTAASARHLYQQYNHWMALQQLYRDAGWGSGEASFDGDEFERMKLDLIKSEGKLRDVMIEAEKCPPEVMAMLRADPELDRRIKEDYGGGIAHLLTGGQRASREEAGKAWSDFWEEKAGDQAMKYA